MTYRMYGVFIASLGVAALILATNETFGGSGAAPGASVHPTSHPSLARSLPHHRRNHVGAIWPGAGDLYGPWNGEPSMDAPPPAPPASGDVHYTYTYDVPWD